MIFDRGSPKTRRVSVGSKKHLAYFSILLDSLILSNIVRSIRLERVLVFVVNSDSHRRVATLLPFSYASSSLLRLLLRRELPCT